MAYQLVYQGNSELVGVDLYNFPTVVVYISITFPYCAELRVLKLNLTLSTSSYSCLGTT
jgi:hypothetical protein